MTPRSVLVTGATGFTGGHVCRRLVDEGRQVRGLVRDPSRAEDLARLGVELAEGDLRDASSLREAVRGVDVVYHIAAMFREENVDTALFREVNAEGTRRMLEAADAAGVERFVHCSTVGVHGEIKDPPANEESPFDPHDHYQRSKLEGERIAREHGSRSQMELAVFRPGGIYGPGDTRFLKLFRAIARKRFLMIGSGEVTYHLVYIDDLVDGILRCGRRPEAPGQVFILTGDRPVTLNEFVAAIADAVGGSVPDLHVPAAPVYAAAAACEFVCRGLGIEPPLYRRRMDFFLKDRAFDISKARRELGYEPSVDVREGVRRTAEWYRSQGLLEAD